MKMIKDICRKADDHKMLVGVGVLVLGATHFGYGMGISDVGIGPSWLTIGNIAGATAVVLGGCMLLKKAGVA